MNVLLTTDYFPPHVGGGVEQATYSTAKELTDLGHQVSVLTLNTCHGSPVENLEGIHVYRAVSLELTNLLGMQSAFSSGAGRLMRQVCEREQTDLVHANNLYFYTTFAACVSLNALDVPLVTSLHIGSVSELDGFARYAAKVYEKSMGHWILGKSNHVVAVSEAVKQYAEKMGVNPSKLSVVPNAVDTTKFHPSSAPPARDGKVRVGFVGRLVPNKGPQYLVDAAPRILREYPNVEFQLAGQGPMRLTLRRRAEELGVLNAFHFVGQVPSMVKFIQGCDVMVRPSLTDGMPLTVLEAMACGLPNVTSRVGGTPEILEDGYSGYLVEPRNVEQLSSRISELVNNPKLRACMGSRARRLVETYYSWNQVAHQLSAIYDRALAS